jgi:hypothetical protein
MPVVVIIEKNGNVKELAMKTNQEEDLFKRAGFKSPTDFKLHTTFNESNYHIRLYGKTRGKANQENKYEFPPPVDKLLFFGSCLLVNTSDDGEFLNLTKKEWDDVYNKLFGGFDDIDDIGNEEDEEEISVEKLTKEGYMKDGFIVDDNNSESGSGSESEILPPLKSQKKIPKSKGDEKPKLSKVPPKKSKKVLEDTSSTSSSFLECKEELEEEAYFA